MAWETEAISGKGTLTDTATNDSWEVSYELVISQEYKDYGAGAPHVPHRRKIEGTIHPLPNVPRDCQTLVLETEDGHKFRCWITLGNGRVTCEDRGL